MPSRCSRLTLAILAGLLIFLPNCHSVGANPSGSQYINLSYNGGACQQNNSTGVIEVYQNGPVVYQGATSLSQFSVQFTTCPFASCPVNSANGSAANAGSPNPATAGTTFNYSGLTINNQQCNNVQSLGVRIKPGP